MEKSGKSLNELLESLGIVPVGTPDTAHTPSKATEINQQLADAGFQVTTIGYGYRGTVDGWEREYGDSMQVFELSHPDYSKTLKFGFMQGEVITLENWEDHNISFMANDLEYWMPVFIAYIFDLWDDTVEYHVRYRHRTSSAASTTGSLYGALAPIFLNRMIDEYKVYVMDKATRKLRLINLVEDSDHSVVFEHCQLNTHQDQILSALASKFRVRKHFSLDNNQSKEIYEIAD